MWISVPVAPASACRRGQRRRSRRACPRRRRAHLETTAASRSRHFFCSVPSYTRAMRWTPRRWFLAGYAGIPLLIGLLGAIAIAIAEHSVGGLMTIVPAVLIACFLAPLGFAVGIVSGISPEGWGPWHGRLVYMGLMAGLAVLVIAARRLEKRNRHTSPVPDGSAGKPCVPAACVLTARRAYRFPTAAWNRLIGPTLLVIAGVALFCLGIAGCTVVLEAVGGA